VTPVAYAIFFKSALLTKNFGKEDAMYYQHIVEKTYPEITIVLFLILTYT
jgi:hypothetical protein